MFKRVSLTLVLGYSASLLVGCGSGNGPEKEPPANSASVTLHVEGMVERQEIS